MLTQKRGFVPGLFVTTDGRLNLFWRVLLFLIIYVVAIIASSILASIIGKSLGFAAAGKNMVKALISIPVVLGLAYAFRRYIDHRPWRAIGLNLKRLPHFLTGFIVAGLMLGLIFGLQYALGWLQVVGMETDISNAITVTGLLVAGLVGYIGVGLTEEVAFRGYIFQNLGSRLSLWLALLVTNFVFAMLHILNGGFGLGFVLSAIILATFLAFTRLTTHALWFAIGWHSAWDWFQYSVLGLSTVNESDYANSLLHVKQTGPELWTGVAPSIEGGLLILLVTFGSLVLVWLWAERQYRGLNWQSRLNEDSGELAEASTRV